MLYLVRSRGLCTLQEQCSGQEKSWLSCISVSFITNTLPQASVNYFLLCAFLILHIWFLPDSPWNMFQPISPDPPFSVHEFFLLLHLHPHLLWLLFQFHITSSILFIGTSDIFWVGAWMVSVSLFDGSLGLRSSIPIW
jgi:hypothetical protein